MHQAGQLDSAAEMYEKVLAGGQENADALHLLGVLHFQKGEHQRAVEEIGRAIVMRPNVPAFHANLAEAYRAQGKFERAVGSCRIALRLSPNYPEALCNLGLGLQGLGRHAEAAEQFRHALQIRQDFATAHSNLGVSLRELGQLDEALIHFRRAVELAPGNASARTNLGQMLVDRGQAEEALPHCQEAVRLQPDTAALHHNLGNALRALERLARGPRRLLGGHPARPEPGPVPCAPRAGPATRGPVRRCARLAQAGHGPGTAERDVLGVPGGVVWGAGGICRGHLLLAAVLAAKPQRATAHNSIAWALQEESRLEEAQEHYRTALRLRPDLAAASLGLGGLQEELGDLTAAEASYREALQLQPA